MLGCSVVGALTPDEFMIRYRICAVIGNLSAIHCLFCQIRILRYLDD